MVRENDVHQFVGERVGDRRRIVVHQVDPAHADIRAGKLDGSRAASSVRRPADGGRERFLSGMQMNLAADGPGRRSVHTEENGKCPFADLFGPPDDVGGACGGGAMNVEVGSCDATVQGDGCPCEACGPASDPSARLANARAADRRKKEDSVHGGGSTTKRLQKEQMPCQSIQDSLPRGGACFLPRFLSIHPVAAGGLPTAQCADRWHPLLTPEA